VSTGRFKAIDVMRRRAGSTLPSVSSPSRIEAATSDASAWDDETVEDDRLRLIFNLLPPGVDRPDAQVALRPCARCAVSPPRRSRRSF
jgi:RNA polymerase sigma-70 factor (ECF subfamily)